MDPILVVLVVLLLVFLLAPYLRYDDRRLLAGVAVLIVIWMMFGRAR